MKEKLAWRPLQKSIQKFEDLQHLVRCLKTAINGMKEAQIGRMVVGMEAKCQVIEKSQMNRCQVLMTSWTHRWII